ncbi:MAG: 2-oxoglutarate oxidoreductase [Deltaproteobacteria bacterium]|jgi:2-oxoglutarate ferredoxin oxidoreductase subunit beta|nr:2-oxoglutarate oxidoreductase [Deltaproteobacteria bacterium]MBW2535594.1 2-oxoglutarate oxidoreductase [Deltaproteobacteria bacterium]
MDIIFKRPDGLTEVQTHYCPGCTHGIIHRLVAESLEELDLVGKAVGVAPVGCSVLAYNYFNCDMFEAAHGRAPAVATGAKRCRPDLCVFTYQGDGDLASIGMAEIIHAANRGEKFTVIFVNNAIYGMTGGQMAPTTMPGQRTSTSPAGRDVDHCGYPIRMAEMIASLSTPAFVARVAVHTPARVIEAKRAVRDAFAYQKAGTCFSFVELLSTCPTNWGLAPLESCDWVETNMVPYYPPGILKRPEDGPGPGEAQQPEFAPKPLEVRR